MIDFFSEIVRYLENLADKRTNEYFLLSSPWKCLSILAFYLFFTRKFLPNLMKNRPALNIDGIILIYNASQIFFNAYLLVKVIPVLRKRSILCAPVDYSDDPISRLELDLINYYCYLKIYDLLDTVFFVLRKRERQITFLHLYHHGVMVVLTWVGAKFVPGGQTIFTGVLNIIVHIVMYFYYAVSLWNSGLNKSIWWKKHLTQLQLFQFLILAITSTNVLLNKNCAFPKSLIFFGLVEDLIFLYMFGKFYYKTYVAPNKNKKFTGNDGSNLSLSYLQVKDKRVAD